MLLKTKMLVHTFKQKYTKNRSTQNRSTQTCKRVKHFPYQIVRSIAVLALCIYLTKLQLSFEKYFEHRYPRVSLLQHSLKLSQASVRVSIRVFMLFFIPGKSTQAKHGSRKGCYTWFNVASSTTRQSLYSLSMIKTSMLTRYFQAITGSSCVIK